MTHPDFRSFFSSERQKLVRYVRSLLRETTAAEAEDVVHDVLLKLLEKADLLIPEDHLAAYVYRSLKNRVIDYLRAHKPTLSLDADQEDAGTRFIDLIHDLKPNMQEALEALQGEQALFVALEELSEMEKHIVIAHEFEGIPFRTLAEEWEVPINTLLSHKSRAIRKLQVLLLDKYRGES